MAITTIPDLLFVALFAVAAPLIDYFIFWPAHRRLCSADPAWSRTWLCAWTVSNQWPMVVSGVAIWMASGRPFAALGLNAPEGWRLWLAIALLLLLAAYQAWAIRVLARSAEHRTQLRQEFLTLATIMPQTKTELRWFGVMSVTAGFCEEFLYRGYFIWTFAPWIGWWGAAALSVPFFAVAHFYQGWDGVLRTAAIGALFTVMVAVFGSLWPSIALHALIDLASGTMALLVLREKQEVTGGP